MYTIRFISFEKKALRTLTDKSLKKALKNKKDYTLVDAEKLLQELVKSSGQTKFSFCMNDEESEMEYTCENVELSDTEPVSIISILQGEIFGSVNELASQEDGGDGDEIAQALFAGLCEQYREERQTTEGGGAPSVDDFAELDEPKPVGVASEPEPARASNSYRVPDFLDSDCSEAPAFAVAEEATAPVVVESAEGAAVPHIPTTHVSPRQKHELLTFPSLEEFLDLSSQSDAIQRCEERQEKENLLNFLGLEQEAGQCLVEEKKCAYAQKRLNDSVFERLRDKFRHSVATLRDRAKTILSDAYNKAVDVDYEAMAEDGVSTELAELEHSQAEELSGFVAEEDRTYDLQLDTFDKGQSNALEIFKRQQEIEKDAFLQRQKEKCAERISLFEQEQRARFLEEKSALLDKELYALKQASKEVLLEERRRTLRELEQGLEKLTEESWDEMMGELSHLREEIEGKTPAFKEDVSKELAEARAARDEKRRDIELELEKDRLLMEQEAVQESRVAAEEKKVSFEREKTALEQIEARLAAFDSKWSGQVDRNNLALEVMEAKMSGKMKTGLLAVGFAAILAVILVAGGLLLSGARGGEVLIESDAILQERLAGMEQQLNEVLEGTAALEDEALQRIELRLAELLYEPGTLDDLLVAGRFDEAVQRYSDHDSLNRIGDAIFEAGALSELISFNRIYRTTFGEFDEALLRRDFAAAYALYRELGEVALRQLAQPGRRLTDFALLLYQNCHRHIAEELLAGI